MWLGAWPSTSRRLPCCRGIFKQLKDTLTLPEACKKAAQQSSLGYLFAHGERHILPSFFNLLIHLQKQVMAMTHSRPTDWNKTLSPSHRPGASLGGCAVFPALARAVWSKEQEHGCTSIYILFLLRLACGMHK